MIIRKKKTNEINDFNKVVLYKIQHTATIIKQLNLPFRFHSDGGILKNLKIKK